MREENEAVKIALSILGNVSKKLAYGADRDEVSPSPPVSSKNTSLLQLAFFHLETMQIGRISDLSVHLGTLSNIYTMDEILIYVDSLKAKVTVNGQTWGTGNTEGMQHSLAEVVSYASYGELLRPGELLATGTIPGYSGIEIGRWLSPGDEIELWIERVGTLKNTIGSPEI